MTNDKVKNSNNTKLTKLSFDPNPNLIAKLYKEIENSKSDFSKITRWNLKELLNRNISKNSPVTFQEMLPLWMGSALINLDYLEQINDYSAYMISADLGYEYKELIDRRKERFDDLTCADLSVPQDYLLIDKFLPKKLRKKRLNILEVGGGFGVLTEEFVTNSELNYCYILADAIPESIWYQYAYLVNRFPDKKIGASFNGDGLDTKKYDIYILSATDIDTQLKNISLDVAINVASVQEMPEKSAFSYMQLFYEKLNQDGLLFFQNSREFFYKREYHHPISFKYVLKETTPRTRGYDYPTDILIKTNKDQSVANIGFLQDYYIGLKDKTLSTIEKNGKVLDKESFYKKKVSALEKKIETNAAKASSKEEKLKARLAIADDKLKNALQASGDNLKKREKLYNTQKSSLESKLINKANSVENLKSKLEEQKKLYEQKLTIRDSSVTKLTDKISSQKDLYDKKLSAKDDAITNNQETINLLKSKLEEQKKLFEDKINSKSKTSDVLKSKLTEQKVFHEEKLASKAELIEKNNKSLDNLKTKFEDHKKINEEKFASKRESFEANKKLIDSLKSKLEELKKQNDDLKDKIKNQKLSGNERLSKLKAENLELKEKIKQTSKSIKDILSGKENE